MKRGTHAAAIQGPDGKWIACWTGQNQGGQREGFPDQHSAMLFAWERARS